MTDQTPDIIDHIYDAVSDFDEDQVMALVQQALDAGWDIQEVLNEGLIAPMDEVGEKFTEGTIFVPEMLMAAMAMKSGLEILRPVLTGTDVKPKATVLLGTVEGDLHDIGKNLVGMMMEGAGYKIVDLGVNVEVSRFLASAEEINPDVIGLSALLTTSMPAMAKTIEAFKARDMPFDIVVGGAPVTPAFADAIGAQGHATDAAEAVNQVRALIGA
jgi:5-methyltetrahydrofolate--homocysteine methyltransferase